MGSYPPTVLIGMKQAGWTNCELAVVQLSWEFEALPPAERAFRRREYAVRMLEANNQSFVFTGNRVVPEPLDQLRTALDEIAAGQPHVFFLKANKSGAPSEARAYSERTRSLILGLATASVTRLHRNLGFGKREAMANVAQLMFEHGYTSSRGKFSGQPDGLTKYCAAAEAGRAPFQQHYDFALRFERPHSELNSDSGVYRLLDALVQLCVGWRLLPHKPTGNSGR